MNFACSFDSLPAAEAPASRRTCTLLRHCSHWDHRAVARTQAQGRGLPHCLTTQFCAPSVARACSTCCLSVSSVKADELLLRVVCTCCVCSLDVHRWCHRSPVRRT
jgi:hypothetical protein